MTEFYANKQVVVTGGAGMVGSALVTLLLGAGADVTVLDNFSRGKTRIPGVLYVYADVGNEGTCRDHIKGADVVFNLAAEVAGVEFNQRHHSFMFERNMRVLSTPLRIAAEYGVGRFLQTSSVCIYPIGRNCPSVEDDGLAGPPTPANEGYSYAKRLGEQLATWYADEGKLHTVIVRPSNIYGPRDYFDERAHVIPALIRKALDDDVIVVNGGGTEEREFIYVTDIARGMMAAVEHGQPGRPYNLGTNGDTCLSIRDLVALIQAATGTTGKEVIWKQLFDGGDDRRYSDASRANAELEWTHEVGMRDGLERVVAWYREARNG